VIRRRRCDAKRHLVCVYVVNIETRDPSSRVCVVGKERGRVCVDPSSGLVVTCVRYVGRVRGI